MNNAKLLAAAAIALTLASGASVAAAEREPGTKPARMTAEGVKAPTAPLPDFVIVAAKPMGAVGNYRVTVKNVGGAQYAEMVLWGTHQKTDGQSWGAAANIKAVFGAGEQRYVDVTFKPGDFARGDRLLFEVDYYKQVTEANENNNKFTTKF